MTYVKKDLKNIPKSLIRGTTLSKRRSLIAQKEFPKTTSLSSKKEKDRVKKFEDKFKEPDIKKKLKNIYNNKCAYCEQYVIGGNIQLDNKSTIEHYRPKGKYYWLAYSWDNLLWCCHGCNDSKSNEFEVVDTLDIFNKEIFLREHRIHNTSKVYNRIEKPLMIHPELESVIDKLRFDKGIINSDDIRVKYTIGTCKLDREVLNEKRKTILKVFIDKLNAKVLEKEPFDDILKALLNEITTKEKEFIALRYWILRNYDLLVEVN